MGGPDRIAVHILVSHHYQMFENVSGSCFALLRVSNQDVDFGSSFYIGAVAYMVCHSRHKVSVSPWLCLVKYLGYVDLRIPSNPNKTSASRRSTELCSIVPVHVRVPNGDLYSLAKKWRRTPCPVVVITASHFSRVGWQLQPVVSSIARCCTMTNRKYLCVSRAHKHFDQKRP